MSRMPGGLTGDKPATEEVQIICEKVKPDTESKVNRKFDQFVAVAFKTQVVAGTNYFIKVDCGDEHLHIRVYKPLQGDLSVHSVQEGKSGSDEISYF